MTAREKKAMEKAQVEALANAQNAGQKMVRALRSFWQDCSALERVAKINGEKYDYKTSTATAMARYEELSFIQTYEIPEVVDANGRVKNNAVNRMWDVVRAYAKSEEIWGKVRYESSFGSEKRQLDKLPHNTLWIDEIVWDAKHMDAYLDFCKMFGVTHIYYTNSSTGALGNISTLIKRGAVVSGTANISEYKNDEESGIVFNLANVEVK